MEFFKMFKLKLILKLLSTSEIHMTNLHANVFQKVYLLHKNSIK